MAEATSNQQSKQTAFYQRRGMKFGIVAGCVLVLVITACVVSYWVSVHSRFKVVGKTDPVTGYHIEYTVSSRYRKRADELIPTYQTRDILEKWRYSPRPPLAVTNWFRKHIPWFREAQQVPVITFGAEFSQDTWLGAASAETNVDSHGFVTIGNGLASPPSAINEHTLSSGCPTTFSADDGSFRGGGGPAYKFRVYNIVVRPRNQPITFVFMAFTNLTREPNDLEREMIAIRDSIRVVRGR